MRGHRCLSPAVSSSPSLLEVLYLWSFTSVASSKIRILGATSSLRDCTSGKGGERAHSNANCSLAGRDKEARETQRVTQECVETLVEKSAKGRWPNRRVWGRKRVPGVRTASPSPGWVVGPFLGAVRIPIRGFVWSLMASHPEPGWGKGAGWGREFCRWVTGFLNWAVK